MPDAFKKLEETMHEPARHLSQDSTFEFILISFQFCILKFKAAFLWGDLDQDQ